MLPGDVEYKDFVTKKFCNATTYDLMPESTKVVILDVNLKVKKAFFVLVTFEMRGAVLYNSSLSTFEGMFTVTDFILALSRYSEVFGGDVKRIEDQRISTWRDFCNLKNKTLVYSTPKTTLRDAFNMLMENKIHRLPILDINTNTVLYIITHKRMLNFYYNLIEDQIKAGFFNESLETLGIGTYQGIIVISYNTTIKTALDMFLTHGVSAFPVVDDEGKLVDVYSKADVISLAADRAYTRLNATISSALLHRNLGIAGVLSCLRSDTFETVLEKLVRGKVHRLIVVDSENKVTGVVSLSDVLSFLFGSVDM